MMHADLTGLFPKEGLQGGNHRRIDAVDAQNVDLVGVKQRLETALHQRAAGYAARLRRFVRLDGHKPVDGLAAGIALQADAADFQRFPQLLAFFERKGTIQAQLLTQAGTLRTAEVIGQRSAKL